MHTCFDARDHFFPTNTATCTKHYDRSMYFVSDHVTYVDGGTGGNSEDTRVAQKIVVKPFRIVMKVKGKKLKYQQNNSQYPENYLPLLALGFCNLNSNSADLNTRLSYYYSIRMRWKDI